MDRLLTHGEGQRSLGHHQRALGAETCRVARQVADSLSTCRATRNRIPCRILTTPPQPNLKPELCSMR
jgi:hypothetical protein